MHSPFNTDQCPRVLRMPELLAVLGISKSTIHNFRDVNSPHHAPDFPSPIRLGHGKRSAMGWRADELRTWIESRPRAVN